MKHPRRAPRDPLKGAMPVACPERVEGQFHGISGLCHFAPVTLR